MRGITSARVGAALALMVGVAACSDDNGNGDPTGPGAELSSEEVQLMMEAWQELPFMAGTASFGVAHAPEGIAFQSGSQEFQEQDDCPEGGSITFEGTVSASETAMNADLTNTANDCQSSDSEGNVWTFNGGIGTTLEMTGSENEFQMNVSQQGDLAFDSSVGSGTCGMNVSVSMQGSENSGQMEMNGSVCGEDVSQSYSW